ncbi:hypothetical protein TNIN_283261 [Trichonephila inaurata madagascariensis]|uniref:Uncharacterized protein n=1 Tax=Trichonephila inaurata madagascariensis TaxID=2747483 RepID=A0A8X6XQ04_9ARAC|nr:hypothetical protein TNIN_283261 [Trichonephila inaurata madagascariensis]
MSRPTGYLHLMSKGTDTPKLRTLSKFKDWCGMAILNAGCQSQHRSINSCTEMGTQTHTVSFLFVRHGFGHMPSACDLCLRF